MATVSGRVVPAGGRHPWLRSPARRPLGAARGARPVGTVGADPRRLRRRQHLRSAAGQSETVARRIGGHGAALQAAADAGVTILGGTDAGLQPHGMIAEEIRLLAATCLGAEQAVGAGSWEARRFLGLPGIEEGALADVVAYPRDPREDISVLAEPSLIILDGSIVERR